MVQLIFVSTFTLSVRTYACNLAWPVNFNLGLTSFEPSIKGLRGLVDLALASPRATPPRVIYISSQGVLRGVLICEYLTSTTSHTL